MSRVLIVVTKDDEFRGWKQERNLQQAWNNSVKFYKIAVDNDRMVVVVGRDPQPGGSSASPYIPIDDVFVNWVNNEFGGNRVGILKHFLTLYERQTVKRGIQNLEFIESYSSLDRSWYSELYCCCTTPDETTFDSLWWRFTDTHWLMYRVLIPIFAKALKNPKQQIAVGGFLDQHPDLRSYWDRFWCSVSDRGKELDKRGLESSQGTIEQVFVKLRDAMLDAMRRAGG
jgi:hypothetical protein